MNLEALRSFLDVIETGSFSLAAVQAGVTQSTVSARIQSLEDSVGVQLFRRSRGGVELTPSGTGLRLHAEQIIHLWDHARLALSLPKGFDGVFRLGGPVAVQEWLSLSWITWMKQNAPTIALRLDAGTSESLCERIVSGMLDAAIMYLPQHRPKLVVEELLREELVMVRHHSLSGKWFENYISVDWGQDFTAQFSREFPEMVAPTITVGVGALAMRYIFALKGSAYLPLSLVQDSIADGKLVLIPAAPRFVRPIFLVYPTQPLDAALLDLVTAGLRQLAALPRAESAS